MTKTIKLSIQEIVCDFEKLVRYDERLDVLFDNQKANDAEMEKFYNEVTLMISKYIPDYKRHLDEKYLKSDDKSYEKALKLYKMLYENFKEIFYHLI